MSKSEAEFMAEALLTDDLPEITESMYLATLLFNNTGFADAVSKILGPAKTEERLIYKLSLWVPHALTMLRSQWWAGIDSWVTTLIKAKECFPDTIGSQFELSELAHIWKEAHVRAGTDAVAYLRSGEHQMRQPKEMTLAAALLAGVSASQLGDPPRYLRRKALRGSIPPKVVHSLSDMRYQEAMREHMAIHRDLNRQLRPLLRKAA